MVTMHSDLSEKISANYSLMNSRIRKEELLYVTTQTPEVYFAEGNNISILNNVNNTSNQELNLDVINNLVNRIIVSGTNNFTYQDNVYISSILRKIGITDVTNFMKQVHLLQEEKNENNKLIKVYESQKNVLYNLIKTQIDENIENHERNEENKYDTNKYYIHDEIYNRLKTGDIYQEVHNHSQGIESITRRIFKNEMAISEQQSLIQNFKLNNLKNQIMYKNEPLYYYHTNTYEMDEDDTEVAVNPEEKISSAILLNLVDQVYSLRATEIQKNSHNWYSVAGALFKTADNTWKRYETYHNEGKKINANIYNTLKEINNSKKNENSIINNIVQEIKNINEGNLVYRQLEEINEVTEGNHNYYDNHNVMNVGDTNQAQYIKEINNLINNTNVISNKNEQNNYENLDFVHYENNVLDEDYTQINEQSYNTETKLQNINKDNIEAIQKLINNTNLVSNNVQQNVQELSNVKHYENNVGDEEHTIINNQSYNTETKLENVNKNNIENLHKLISDTNIISNNTEQSVQEFLNFVHYENDDSDEEHTIRDVRSQITETELEKINQKNIENYQKLLEIESQRPRVTNVTINKEKARKDILRAMENPGEVINEYLNNNEIDVHEEINLGLNQEIYNMFSDETKAIFSQLYQHNNIEFPKEVMPTEIVYPYIEDEAANEDALMESLDNYYTNENVVYNEKSFVQNLESPAVRYEINEIIAEQIKELKNNQVNNIYERYFHQDGVSQSNMGTKDKTNLLVEGNKKAQQEASKYMNEALTEDELINNISVYKTTTKDDISLIHRNEEQIVTEEHFDTVNTEEIKNNKINNITENNSIQDEPLHTDKKTKDMEISLVEENKKAQLELTHYMNEVLLKDNVIQNTNIYKTTTQKVVDLIHKEEEQIITEELFDTIKKQAVDTVREETVENREVHNVVSNERVFNETVNRFNYNTQENIEELVQKNVKKQINTISEQVYGKIEKKLQHERKRRGY